MDMKTLLLLAVFFVFVCLLDQCLAVKQFYVHPSGSRYKCRYSHHFPCHELKYYAKHSMFQSNSIFHFFHGKIYLDRTVLIKNVENLALLGVNSGVEISCTSHTSGFHVEMFSKLSIENIALSNCRLSQNATLLLSTGSEVSLKHVSISGPAGLAVIDVMGSLSISDSNFQGGNILITYSLCKNRSSDFEFTKNTVTNGQTVQISILCSNVQMLIGHCTFKSHLLSIDYGVLTKNSVLISNSTFSGKINISVCTHCEESRNLFCDDNFLKLTNISSGLSLDYSTGHTKNCTIFVESSHFSSMVTKSYVASKSTLTNTTFVHANLSNVTFAGSVNTPACNFHGVAILFANCSFKENGNSAIKASQSKVTFQGKNTFKSNSAPIGAGMQLLDSYMYLKPHTHILFEDNHADYVGGAIYIANGLDARCFFHINSTLIKTIGIDFSGNTAGFVGSSLFGNVGKCCSDSECDQFYNVFHVSNSKTNPLAIASDPDDVCLCENGKLHPNCSDTHRAYSTHAFPGQYFPVRLAAVSFGFSNVVPGGVVPGAIRAYFTPRYNATLGPFQSYQVTDKSNCSDFNYSVNSTAKNVTFEIISEQNFFKQVSLSITVNLEDCPLGFSLSPATSSCECEPWISNDNIECDINDQSFLGPAGSWIGFINESSNVSGVIFHRNCPINYCLPHQVKLTLNTSDSQCDSYRTGLLCGKCEDGYSLTLGNQRCESCSNLYLLLILPLTMSGLILVAVLFAFNLTVTEGSINGLIFYANVMAMNHTVLYSGESRYLYTFLAWLNLDLGISSCLFDGMDGYTETWLQFAFPAYLWMIILVIILLYNKFSCNRLGGRNAVKVLATLLLLSYTKLQRTVVTILSFTWLKYPDGVLRYVWLNDANVEFFKGKHLYLGTAGILVLVFLIVPYTLCLAFFQQLQACSGRKLFQWVNKLKPVFDSYAGPYKDKYRFWTGMLLLVRTLLIILFTINTAGSADFNLLVILVVSCALLMAHSNGTYKKWPCNYVESFFYLNLAVFAGSALYARHNHGNIRAVEDISIGSTLTTFLIVVGYHILCRIRSFMTQEEEDDMEFAHERLTDVA